MPPSDIGTIFLLQMLPQTLMLSSPFFAFPLKFAEASTALQEAQCYRKLHGRLCIKRQARSSKTLFTSDYVKNAPFPTRKVRQHLAMFQNHVGTLSKYFRVKAPLTTGTNPENGW